jgi:hypothetical protein
MKKLILVVSFLSFAINIFAQKNNFSIGVSAYNHLNDRYGYKFNQFSRVFITNQILSQPIKQTYRLLNFHLSYTRKIDSLYSITFANDLFLRTYREKEDFALRELGLRERAFSTTTLCISRNFTPKWRSILKFRGITGIAFRTGQEKFNNGSIYPHLDTYAVNFGDLGLVLGGEVRYNLSKRFFVNSNLNFIEYFWGIKEEGKPSIFNKSWSVFQANFSVGVNF